MMFYSIDSLLYFFISDDEKLSNDINHQFSSY